MTWHLGRDTAAAIERAGFIIERAEYSAHSRAGRRPGRMLRFRPRFTSPSGTTTEVQVMLRAVWNGVVLAETPRTIRLEGSHYFPPDSLNREYFAASRTRSVCPWKGLASYYTVVVDGQPNPDAAWYYPHPSPLARRIRNHVAFWNGVRIEGEQEPERGDGRSGTWWRRLIGRRGRLVPPRGR